MPPVVARYDGPVDEITALGVLELAEEIAPGLTGPDAGDGVARLEARAEELGAALDWFGEGGRADEALRLANALYRYWITQRRFEEAWRVLQEGQSLEPSSIQTHISMGRVHYYARRYDEAAVHLRAYLEVDQGPIGWAALAREHGFGSTEGRFALGRFIVEGRDEDGLVLYVITPIPAGLDSQNVPAKGPPIMFDRTPAGDIIVPGGWWQLMFEQVTQDESMPTAMREMAASIATNILCNDALLPADADTIEVLAPVSATASWTVLKTGTPSTSCPALPGVTPATRLVP